MTRLPLLGMVAVCLLAILLTSCGEDGCPPTKVCIPTGENHPPQVTFINAFAEGILRGEPVRLPITASGDTVPMGAEVTFEWSGEDPDNCGRVIGYRYRITGYSDYTMVDHTVTSVTFTGLPSGVIEFRLGAIDDKWAVTDPEIVRGFVSNFAPDTWYESQFIEKREIDGAFVDIVHQEGDTVAIGSKVVIVVRGTDPDGDDSKLRYWSTKHYITTCDGRSGPGFGFFDNETHGPRYVVPTRIVWDPKYSGIEIIRSAATDEYGWRDFPAVEFRFYSNLPPIFSLADIIVNGDPLSQTGSFVSTDGISVRVTSATDPDPGNVPIQLETRCEIEGLDVTYSDETEWQALGEEMMIGPVPEGGRYRLTVFVMDYGCRESKIEKEIVITGSS